MERLSVHRPSILLTMVSKWWQYVKSLAGSSYCLKGNGSCCNHEKTYKKLPCYFSGCIFCAHVIPPPKGEVPHHANHTFCSMKFCGGLEFSTGGGKSLSMSTVKISPSALRLLFSPLTPAP